MPQAAQDDAVYKLKNVESGSLLQKNMVFTDYLPGRRPTPPLFTVNCATTKHATVTDGKGGVFWHIQGSGKSLSIV